MSKERTELEKKKQEKGKNVKKNNLKKFAGIALSLALIVLGKKMKK